MVHHSPPRKENEEHAGQHYTLRAGRVDDDRNRRLIHNAPMDEKRAFLRHAVATIAYRGGKALRDAPETFATFQVAPTTRTPIEILAHVGDLFDWALSIAQGAERWNNSTPLVWEREITRFFATLERFDAHLASEAAV